VRSPFFDRCSQAEGGLSKTLPLVLRSPVKKAQPRAKEKLHVEAHLLVIWTNVRMSK